MESDRPYADFNSRMPRGQSVSRGPSEDRNHARFLQPGPGDWLAGPLRIAYYYRSIEGELVAVDADGIPRFQMLQHRSRTPKSQIVYYAFDVLSVEGKDLKSLRLKDRKAALTSIAKGSHVLLSESLPGPPERLIEAAKAMKLEGVVAKRIDAKYEPGLRTGAWQKNCA